MELTVAQLVRFSGGKLLCGSLDATVTGASIDSRRTKEGDLFIPLIGERSNGHEYIEAAFARGAVATLTQEHKQMDDKDHAWIWVPNTEHALQEIAKAYREQFTIPIVGVTGSVGKTTTKEMLALALSAQCEVMKTKGNFNSQVGLPMTLFQLEPTSDVAVVEMGMSRHGEMARLAEIARPNFAVLTNIGISHIENLKTQEAIRREKLQICNYFSRHSVLFLNGDDPMLSSLVGFLPCKVVVYGTRYNAQYQAIQIETEDHETVYTLKTPYEAGRTVRVPAIGHHNVLNSLAAIAVCDTFGLSLKEVISKLGTYVPPSMRQEIHQIHGITLVDDTYNASPDSIRSGLDVLKGLECHGRRVAVLADMMELGSFSQQAHHEVGTFVADAGVDVLVTIGKRAEDIGKGAKEKNPYVLVARQRDNESAAQYLEHKLKAGDCVLIKGSRSMKTDEIVRSLLQYYTHLTEDVEDILEDAEDLTTAKPLPPEA